jgi:hypothetical protein
MDHFQLDTHIPKPIGKKTGLIDIPMLNEKEFGHATTLSTYPFKVKSKKNMPLDISALPSGPVMEKLGGVNWKPSAALNPCLNSQILCQL